MDTENYIAQIGGANLIIFENNEVHVQALDIKSKWLIGRYHPNMPHLPDIALLSMIVSKEHGWLHNIDNQWYYVDNPENHNGTFHNGVMIPRPMPGMKRPTPLENGDILRIDNGDLNHVSSKGVLMLFTTISVNGVWTSYQLNKQTVLIGRDSTCDIVEPIPYVSLKHAKITYINGIYYLSDCKSRSGTYLNGKQVTSSTILHEKDCISICDCYYFFADDKLLYTKRNREGYW